MYRSPAGYERHDADAAGLLLWGAGDKLAVVPPVPSGVLAIAHLLQLDLNLREVVGRGGNEGRELDSFSLLFWGPFPVAVLSALDHFVFSLEITCLLDSAVHGAEG